MDNLLLCGFMGCGKSTVGRRLAGRLHMRCIDLDACIEEEAGCTIPEIFAAQGEETFRELEHQAVLGLRRRHGCVVAVGGGTFTFERNVQAIPPENWVVFLDADFESCYARIQNSSRPLVRQNSKEQLQAIFERRRPLYQAAARITVDASRHSGIVTRSVLQAICLVKQEQKKNACGSVTAISPEKEYEKWEI